jgi:hypothetical protein
MLLGEYATHEPLQMHELAAFKLTPARVDGSGVIEASQHLISPWIPKVPWWSIICSTYHLHQPEVCLACLASLA